MKLNFIPSLQRDAASDSGGGILGAIGGLNPATTVLGIGQSILGAIQGIGGNQRLKRLMSQRKAYSTPEEFYQILQATQNRASEGFDAFSLNYMTSQTDRAFSEGVGDINRLGGDANDVASLFDRKVQGLMKIGVENHAENLKNFNSYLSAVDMIGKNKEAEWASEQDILKDKMQAAGADKAAGTQNVFNGINAVTANMTAKKQADLFQTTNSSTPDLVSGFSPGVQPTSGLFGSFSQVVPSAATTGANTGSGNEVAGWLKILSETLNKRR
jgi:hypothetical protein